MSLITFTAGSLPFELIVIDPAQGHQRQIHIAPNQAFSLDSAIVAISNDVPAKVAAGRMVVTTGTLPARNFGALALPGSSPMKSALAAQPAAVASAVANASDLPTAIALINDLKAKSAALAAQVNEMQTIINAMNA